MINYDEKEERTNRNALTVATGRGIILCSEAQDYPPQRCLLMLNVQFHEVVDLCRKVSLAPVGL